MHQPRLILYVLKQKRKDENWDEAMSWRKLRWSDELAKIEMKRWVGENWDEAMSWHIVSCWRSNVALLAFWRRQIRFLAWKMSPSNLESHQIPKLKCLSSRLVAFFAHSTEAVENEDVVGAAPTGGALTTSEWSTILLPTKVWLIIEIGWYVLILQ